VETGRIENEPRVIAPSKRGCRRPGGLLETSTVSWWLGCSVPSERGWKKGGPPTALILVVPIFVSPPLVPAAAAMIVIIVMEGECKERHTIAIAIPWMVIAIVIVVTGAAVAVPALVAAIPSKALAAVPAVNLLNQAVIH